MAITLAVAGALAIAFIVAVAFNVTEAFALAFAFSFPFEVAIDLALVFTIAGAVGGIVAIQMAVAVAVGVAITIGFKMAGVVAVTFILFSVDIAWRALNGDEGHALIRRMALAFTTIGATSFRGADLTDANFSNSKIKITDFRNAILTRTCWKQVKSLELVCQGKTYLNNPKLRQLLTGKRTIKNFDHQDLRGVNLQGVNLAAASFIGTDLSDANLQDADLSGAKLVQTQLNKTDLTGATLTGACIQDWHINSQTKVRIQVENRGFCLSADSLGIPTKSFVALRRKPLLNQ